MALSAARSRARVALVVALGLLAGVVPVALAPGASADPAAPAPAAGATDWTPGTPVVPQLPNGSLDDVDCASATACIAVGATTRDRRQVPLVESWDGSSWTVLPVDAPATGDARLSAVSCPAVGACAAVGSVEDPANGGPRPLVVSSLAGAWTTTTLAPPPGRAQAELRGVSCAGPATCVAVGRAGPLVQDGFHPWAAAYRLRAGVWRPLADVVQYSPTSWLNAVSCATASSCLALGQSFNKLTGVSALTAQSYDGTTWTASPVATPPAPASGPWLTDLDCASPGRCTAVGGARSPTDGSQSLVEVLDGGTWTIARVPVVPGHVSVGLRSVSCVAATRCTAVGDGQASAGSGAVDRDVPVVVRRAGGAAWTSTTLDVPPGGGRFTGVSCADEAHCAAVGGTTHDLPFAAASDGSTWTDARAAVPSGFFGGAFTGVSCPAADTCTAVGYADTGPAYGDDTVAIAERWDGSTWTIQDLPDLGDARLDDVVCPAVSVCFAVGVSNTNAPLLVQWRAGAWRQITLANPIGGGAVLDDVSCSSTTSCLAVGHTGSTFAHDTYAVALAGTRWGRTPGVPDDGSGLIRMTGVSCVTGGCHVVISNEPGRTATSRDVIWDGSTWAPGPAMPAAGRISCARLTDCTATSTPQDTSDAEVAALHGGAWASETLPLPAGSAGLRDVTCRTDASCVLVGGTDLVVARVAGTWTRQPVSPSGEYAPAAVSCPPTGRCVAVGGSTTPTVLVGPSA